MRLDKFLSNLGYGSRKEVAKLIKDYIILVNDEEIQNKEHELNFWDIITIGDDTIEYKEHIYVLLNKSFWYVSSRKQEANHPSYLELLDDCAYAPLVEIVGRLDYDTTGMILLTNNGALTHQIIHPKKEIFKTYLVQTELPLSQRDIQKLENGVKIEEDVITRPAHVNMISPQEIHLSISEGRFHQIKKMLEAVGNKVTKLHRLSIGNLWLWDLTDGKWRYLSEEEVQSIF